MTDYGFVNRTKKVVNWAGVLMFAIGLLVASGGQVYAKPTYLSTFNSTYGTSGTALDSCSLCHPGSDTKTFNPYANAFASAGHSFTAIANSDSDGDGSTNIVEITARTFPGDANSKPTVTPPPPPVTVVPPPPVTVVPPPPVTVVPPPPVTVVPPPPVTDVPPPTVAFDTDGDGVPDNMDAFPSDNRRATVSDPMGGLGMATIDTAANAGTRLQWVDSMADTDASLNQTGKPAGYTFPNGVVTYVVAGLVPGGTANVVITYPSAIPANSRIFKVDSAGYHEFPGAVINGNTVTLTLRDGGEGDADGLPNGSIDDPVAVATPLAAVTPPAPAPAASGAESVGGGGCAVAGTGGDPVDAAGAYGFLALIALGLLVRKAAPGKR